MKTSMQAVAEWLSTIEVRRTKLPNKMHSHRCQEICPPHV